VLELRCGSAGMVSGLPAEAQVVLQEQYNQCGSAATQSQTPEAGHINVRNMLSI